MAVLVGWPRVRAYVVAHTYPIRLVRKVVPYYIVYEAVPVVIYAIKV
jgi:hypothetical protein